MKFLFCGNCGALLREENRFCPECGEERKDMGRSMMLVLPAGINQLDVLFEKTGNESDISLQSEIDIEKIVIPEPCYLEALKCAVEKGTVSISLLQRRLSIGYNYAGKIIGWMEGNKLIGPFSETANRKVYLREDQLSKLINRK